MASYWLYDGTSTYTLESNMLNIDLGTPKRRYSLKEYAGAHGGIIKGMGFYGTREIKVNVKYTNITGTNTWTSTRNNLFNWINKAKWETLYFYILHDDGTTETRVQCYPTPDGTESYSYIKASESFGIRFLCAKPYFQSTSSTSDTVAITSSTTQTVSLTNSGKLETSCLFSFTPTGNETSWKVEIADSYGFTLEKVTFLAGQEITYDCADGAMTIAGLSVNAKQYLTSGSLFNIPIGDSDIYVTASGAGSFEYLFYPRWI